MTRKEVEVCPYCDDEIIVEWDIEKNGYQTTCPSCGEKIMLCDACLHGEDNEGMFCDWSEDEGCFRCSE